MTGHREVFAGLCADGVVVAEAAVGDAAEPLFLDEEMAVANAVGKRRSEFALGRTCARKALRTLGCDPVALPVGPGRAPVWPNRVVGSITHCRGLAAAAVAWRDQFAGLGIDAEPDEPISSGVADLVALPEERQWLDAREDAAWGRVLFSAKESVYKAWYPMTGRWLGYEDAVVRFDVEAGTFSAEIRLPPSELDSAPSHFNGRFRRIDNFVVTAVAVEAWTPAVTHLARRPVR